LAYARKGINNAEMMGCTFVDASCRLLVDRTTRIGNAKCVG